MSVTASPPPPATAQRPPVGEACPLCGAPLQPEQEWCLRCGAAARTRLAASPNWKTPIALLVAVIALSLGVLAAALIKLAGGSGSSTATPITSTVTTAPTAVVPTTATPGTTTPGALLPDTTTTATVTTPTTTLPGAATPGATTTPRTAIPSTTAPGATAPGLVTPTSKR